MLKKQVIVTALMGLFWGTAQADEADLRDNLRYLEERIQVLEQQKGKAEEEIKAKSPITFSGLVEVEATSSKDYQGVASSDITLATVELVAEAHVNAWTHAQLVYLFEEDKTEPGEIDQGVLTLGNAEATPFFLSAGRMYVPFGRFETGMISDPLTLELGETRESAVLVGFDQDAFSVSFFTFNGDSQKVGEEDRVAHYGGSLGYASDDLDIGVSYISSLADSDANQEAMAGSITDLQKRVAGIAAYTIVRLGTYTLITEYVGATEAFEAADIAFKGKGARPSAWNLELDYGFDLGGHEVSLGIARQQTAEALNLGLPESATLAVFSVGLSEKTAVSLEYAVAEDYRSADGGSGEKGNALTLQLAAQF